MALPKQRHTIHRRDRARKELELSLTKTETCKQCGGPKLSHRICPKCGTYNGRVMIDTTPKLKQAAK